LALEQIGEVLFEEHVRLSPIILVQSNGANKLNKWNEEGRIINLERHKHNRSLPGV